MIPISRSPRRALRHALVLAALAAPSLALAQGRPMTVPDLALARGVADPRISPDGRSVAYVVSTTDLAADRGRAEIVVSDLAGGGRRKVADGQHPRWSPDGRAIAFLGGSGEQRGIWIVTAAGGEPRFLARIHTSDHFLGHRAVKGFAWSPDGARIAFTSADAAGPAPESDVRAFDRILYKTRTGFTDGRVTHLYVADVATGAVRQLTRGRFDEHSLAWSPDSRRLAFISNRSADPDANYWDDVWMIDVDTGRETQVTRTVGTEFTPAFSPDGRSIAYLGNVRAMNTKDSSPEDTHVYVVPAGGGPARNLTASVDRRVSEFGWTAGGREIVFAAADRGANVVHAVEVASARARPLLTGDFQARSVSMDRAGGRMVFARQDMTHPAEVWTAAADGSGARQVSRENDEFVRTVALRGADSLWTVSPDGTPVQGWLMKPLGWREGRKYPLVLYIHGGPHGMYGHAFQGAFQLLAARGYGVLFLNPRGSSGYGQRFSDGTVMNWGGGDYADLMAGVDAALARNAWIDRERLGVAGGSYGGYMTNWIVSRTPRFKGAVAIASVSNLISFYGTSLYTDLVETEFNGMPWDNYALLWQWSPLAHVEGARTPTLFLHGELDHDVPITQAEEMFMALRKQGVPAQLVRYPGEGHGVSGPRHVQDFYGRILDWFDRHVKGGGSTASTAGEAP
jgi:dipeptidyl aminopeptidase/acylaminoacyl peptidase